MRPYDKCEFLKESGIINCLLPSIPLWPKDSMTNVGVWRKQQGLGWSMKYIWVQFMLCLFIHAFTQAFQAAPFHLGPVSLITFLYACYISSSVALLFDSFWLGCCPYSSQELLGSWFKFHPLPFLNSWKELGLALKRWCLSPWPFLSFAGLCQASPLIFSSLTELPAENNHIILTFNELSIWLKK